MSLRSERKLTEINRYFFFSQMDSFRILGYNQYQEMSTMSNSRISFSRTALLHGLQMTGLLRERPG